MYIYIIYTYTYNIYIQCRLREWIKKFDFPFANRRKLKEARAKAIWD